MKLLTIDPGAHLVGWASFEDGRLARCGLVRESKLGLGHAIAERFQSNGAYCDRVVIELPQVYGRRSPIDPNDLITLAVTVGRVAQALGHATPIEFVHPHAWKGSVPAEVMLKRIASRLDTGEAHTLHTTKVPASLEHNVIDAIGIGLWALKRLGRK